MCDVQDGLGIKNICHLVRNEIHEIFETKIPTKEMFTLKFVVILWQE